jgi:drug/metabolite transporter (DMT)-like permease
LPFSLYAYGETTVTSVLAGIWNATTPLLTLVVVLAVLPEEQPTRSRITGLAIGFAGVLMVLGFWSGLGGAALLGNLACLAAACCYGLGYPYSRRVLAGRSESTLALAAGQLLCGTIELGIVTPFTTRPTGMPLRVVFSILALGALGTGIAYVLNYTLVRDVGATITSTVTYVIPLFSTVAGVVFLGEHLSWNQPIGALIVILGVAVSQERASLPWPARRAAPGEPKGRR